MNTKSIMIQGTSSSVGKSLICTALCRIFTQDDYKVNPFKSQNMASNIFHLPEGLEMARPQAMQAEAAKKTPSVEMNPILLKPLSDQKSQVVLMGKAQENMDAKKYFAYKKELRGMVQDTYNQLAAQSDIMVIEGAGSPAEINLKQDDIVNMGMAKMAKAPVILIGDIDPGGVFAALAGTLLLLDDEERRMVKGVIINKFRGDLDILKPGLGMLEEIIKIPVLGVIPHTTYNEENTEFLAAPGSGSVYQDEFYEKLAAHVGSHLDMKEIYRIVEAGLER